MRKNSGASQIKIRAEFSFFAVLGFVLCTDSGGVSAMCLAACFLHELGHITVMFMLRRPPSAVTFCGGGIRISGGSCGFAAVSAGVAVNLALFAVFAVLPWEDNTLRLFGVINLLAAAFNLLPIGTLDGKRMLDIALKRAFSPSFAIKLSDICEAVMLCLVIPSLFILVFSGFLNFSAVIFVIYVLAVEILNKI